MQSEFSRSYGTIAVQQTAELKRRLLRWLTSTLTVESADRGGLPASTCEHIASLSFGRDDLFAAFDTTRPEGRRALLTWWEDYGSAESPRGPR